MKSCGGARGTCRLISRLGLATASIGTPIASSNGRHSIRVTLPVRSFESRRTAVQGNMEVQGIASRVNIRVPRRRFVLMHIAMVCKNTFDFLLEKHTILLHLNSPAAANDKFYFFSTCHLAFDDQTSTFIVPSGAGFEIVLCPGGRSTRILETSKQDLIQLTQDRRQLSRDLIETTTDDDADDI